ncbi:bifunctional aspartate kinase/homoserine dehydrogenase I [Aureitalea marina]|uniref:Bifunctional aspartate kinase/homoserine dehydrogenase I n=1 Tax=Aureitalea marina TaxID=930804 RepID=A0A2S7KM11_9FLAO|nr:bifunctional aspartate kinase/homoserine dehydrogenase I [Aureitalea marina]PQB03631.1 bifunctional aspartate kinase/homoserine dehydrogenase I [Aureitalea marina]
MKVLKFGGTSVASHQSISAVIRNLLSQSSSGPVIAVVSALGGVTDLLQQAGEQAVNQDQSYKTTLAQIRERHLEVVHEFDLSKQDEKDITAILDLLDLIVLGLFAIGEFSVMSRDKVLSFGEWMSSIIISKALAKQSSNSQWADSRELIVTDEQFTCAGLLIDETKIRVREYFKKNQAAITIMPGFISRSRSGYITTLGRGGSDYTAAIVAASLEAEELQIWTDVSGMYTAHPKWVKQAFPIEELSYQEAMELSHFGAKVIYPPTVQPALQKQIPIRVKNTFAPEDQGTLISAKVNNDRGIIKGISHLPDIALITLEGNGMVGIPGFSKRLFETLSLNKINVVMITQASSEHSICVGIQREECERARQVIDGEFAYEISLEKINPILVEVDLCIVAVIGDNIKGHQGVSGKMFSALGQNNVNIRAIAQGASERNISAVIDSRDVKKAVNTLHNSFFEKQVNRLNLFIKGVGNVGGILLEQIRQQRDHLLNELLVDVRVCGISNSRTMVFSETGIDLDNWQEELASGETQEFDSWMNRIIEMNLRNSVFLDVTASEEVAMSYSNYLRKSIAVVACNKIACSSAYHNYRELKSLAREYHAPFLFETNVGAGLPVINTLKNLINSGDRIRSIQAVLSGSLNFIFNHLDATNSFHDIVLQAQQEGYTEPDPRIDLSGVDVMRKILILIRESGVPMELEDIGNESFLPNAVDQAGSVDEFFALLQKEDAFFTERFVDAQKKGCKLKYVAEFTDGKAKVGLKEIREGHPFYNLEGKDNIVLFYTDRYSEQPLIIKGAGAGSEVTASGLFGDVISLAKN